MVSAILSPVVSFVSSFFRVIGGRACRFHPSCSAYAHEALQTRRGPAAVLLIAGRLSRCHPFSAGGYDPVPRS